MYVSRDCKEVPITCGWCLLLCRQHGHFRSEGFCILCLFFHLLLFSFAFPLPLSLLLPLSREGKKSDLFPYLLHSSISSPSLILKVSTPTIERCFSRHTQDYSLLSSSPSSFPQLVEAVTLMQATQPNFTKEELGEIGVPVIIVQSERDEFIKVSLSF